MGLALRFVKVLQLPGGVCLVERGGRVGVCPWMSKPADRLKGDLDSSGGSCKGSVGYGLAVYWRKKSG